MMMENEMTKELSLREIQLVTLDILKEIDSFCREYAIKYFVFYGTLIGAVRHNGFIPWDDDVDIAMPRDDYERFLELYTEKGKYRVINYLTEKSCPFMITRITDDNYRLFSKYGPNYKIGTFVDVYPLDGVGNSIESGKQASNVSRRYTSGLGKSLERNVIGTVKDTHNGLKKWLLLSTYIMPKVLGVSFYRKKLLALRKQYPQYKDSAYVGSLIWALYPTDFFHREWVESTMEIEFEGIPVKVPIEYDRILKQSYGNYMELPPEKDRIAHHYYKIFRV